MLQQTDNGQSGRPRIIAVGGGKGGVGKSIISCTLALTLADMGKQVVLFDADLGGANLHTAMGVHIPPFSLFDFYAQRRLDINRLVLKTPVRNLRLISGAPGTLGMADIRIWEKMRTIRYLRRIDADYVIVDIGAGSSFTEIDLFNAADDSIVIAFPEPTSIQECYNFIKIALYRKLRREFMDSPEVMELLDRCADPTHLRDRRILTEIADEVRLQNPRMGVRFFRTLNNFSPKLILNRVHSYQEYMDGLSLQLAAQDLLRIKVEYWGYVGYANHLTTALRSGRPEQIIGTGTDLRRKANKIVRKFILKQDVDYQEPGARIIVPITDLEKFKRPQRKERICSVECPLWGGCYLQRGGMPCRMGEGEYELRVGRKRRRGPVPPEVRAILDE